MTSTSSDAEDSRPQFHDNHENNLQPFFVLHHRHRRTARKTTRVDVSQARKSEEGQTALLQCDDEDDEHLHTLRIDAFKFVWSKINTSIKDVIRDINISIFNDVNSWVHESFKAIRSCGVPDFVKATRSYPIATDAPANLFVGLVYTKNMEFVDDQLTFEELGVHLKLHGCHVAKLSPVDFSAKNGIGGCLTILLRQFLKVMLDAADMSIMASWYCGQRENKPVVIIIEDMERCSGSILSDFIMILSEWVVKIPIVLVMGVTTTLDAPRNVLSSNALQRLCSSKFILKSPAQRMDAIVQAVLLRPCSWFTIGHKVALFMRDYFVKHDGTLTSFIRALKIACMQHFSTEPLSFLLKDIDAADDFQIWSENHAFKWGMLLNHISQLHSCRRIGEPTSGNLANALTELRRVHKCWATVVMCLYEAEKSQNNQLLDLYCEALDPDPHRSRTYHDQGISSQRHGCFSGGHAGSSNSGSVSRAARKVRDLQPGALSELLKSWETLADENSEIGKKVKELQSMMKSTDGKSSGYDSTDISLRHSSRGISVVNEKALTLIEWMIRDYMKPIEGLPLHEIFCFKKIDRLQTALLGDPRKAIQADLLEFHKYLCCSCCSNRENSLLPSLHDTSIMYILAQEHGDVINVHDWYQSFKATVTRPPTKVKSKLKHCSSSKKRKDVEHSHSYNEAAIQARFCRAVSELQITGLLRMPSKRRPDYVQRVAFGL